MLCTAAISLCLTVVHSTFLPSSSSVACRPAFCFQSCLCSMWLRPVQWHVCCTPVAVQQPGWVWWQLLPCWLWPLLVQVP